MRKKLLIFLGCVLMWIAQINIAAACGIDLYEPEVPAVLRK